ncbi:MAG: hypothetical protein ACJ77M_19295 [Thermoleophilaceae bacterium]
MTVTPGFAASYAALCGAQGLTVAAFGCSPFTRLERLKSRAWAAIPVASIVATIAAIRAASGTADGLTWLALVTTPPLAAVAFARVVHGARTSYALACVPLFALAWALRDSLAGDAAAVVLTAAGCLTLAALLRSPTPVRWLEAGIVLMALADTALVIGDLLQAPNAVLDIAAPGAGLPQFQRAEFGDAVMGYGDLFVAALLGAVLAGDRRLQRRGALLTTGFALLFGTLFFFVGELPATVPVAAALVACRWGAATRTPIRQSSV